MSSGTAVLVGTAVGVTVSCIHVNSGGLEKSTWSASMELIYTLIGMFVLFQMLTNPNSHRTTLLVLLVASSITAYHMVLTIKKNYKRPSSF